MNPSVVTKMVDASATQGRKILWLACGHKISLKALPDDVSLVGREVPCRFCPDPPPVIEAPPSKTATQLWKDAGEP